MSLYKFLWIDTVVFDVIKEFTIALNEAHPSGFCLIIALDIIYRQSSIYSAYARIFMFPFINWILTKKFKLIEGM